MNFIQSWFWILLLTNYLFYYTSQEIVSLFILLYEKFLQFDWLRAVVFQAIPMKGPLQIMKKAMRKNSNSFLQSSVQSVQRHNPAEFVNRLKD